LKTSHIRNFSIIAHIDHGKSTLADRLIEITGTVAARQMEDQLLDQMDLERERGITIKAQAVRLDYTAQDGQTYMLNLIDTPGHVDFSYEVSRSLAACEGALLVIDASQGIEAQTLANVYLALDHNLEIIPVINKIDLPSADVEKVKREIEEVIGIDAQDAVLVSAKSGEGVPAVLEAIVNRIPAPKADPQAPTRALIFDSHFDSYRGVISYVRIMDGTIAPGMKIQMMHSGRSFEVTEVGVFRPSLTAMSELGPGQVGYVIAGIKNLKEVRVGDTITDAARPAQEPLPGYRKVTPMVYCGMYPVESSEFDNLRDALEKLQLNDASLTFEAETSAALGFGFRCGFLGLLHMDVVQERLEREYQMSLVITAPNVIYRVRKTDGEVLFIDNPSRIPVPQVIEAIGEPYVKATIIVPNDFVGAIMELSQEKRGEFKDMKYMDTTRVMLTYHLPLSEIIYDYFDRLKTVSRGYASLDYELMGYQESDLVKLDILLNEEPVDALSVIVHREKSVYRGRQLVEKLRSLIPGNCSQFRFRPPSAIRSSPAKRSAHCARTCWRNVTAATSPANASCWKNKRKGKNA
jgi:GTP-binding protein LepA